MRTSRRAGQRTPNVECSSQARNTGRQIKSLLRPPSFRTSAGRAERRSGRSCRASCRCRARRARASIPRKLAPSRSRASGVVRAASRTRRILGRRASRQTGLEIGGAVRSGRAHEARRDRRTDCSSRHRTPSIPPHSRADGDHVEVGEHDSAAGTEVSLPMLRRRRRSPGCRR